MASGNWQQIVENNYDLGEVECIKPLTGGCINRSYAIAIQEKRYCLRVYNELATLDGIRFEHQLIRQLTNQKRVPTAELVTTREGTTYIEDQQELLALFEFLPHPATYEWDRPQCSPQELRSAARLLARYHQTVSDWSPTCPRRELRMAQWIESVADELDECKNSSPALENFLHSHRDAIISHLQQTHEALEKATGLTELAIHGDYHPGNITFHSGEATALFDFDWAQFAPRCFDIALALVYFCACWQDNKLESTAVSAFLDAYGEAGAGLAPGPLTKSEKKHLPRMIHAASLYILHWVLQNFSMKEEQRYIRYLRHYLLLLERVPAA